MQGIFGLPLAASRCIRHSHDWYVCESCW